MPANTDVAKIGISKCKSVTEELNLYVQTTQPSKRTGKTVELLEETPSLGTYKPNAHTCGFKTARPITWLQAFEQYIHPSILTATWTNYRDEKGLFFETQIHVYNRGQKTVTIHVYLSTGIIIFKGLDHLQWVAQHFPKIQAEFRIIVDDSASNCPNITTNETSSSIESNTNRSSDYPNCDITNETTAIILPTTEEIIIMDSSADMSQSTQDQYTPSADGGLIDPVGSTLQPTPSIIKSDAEEITNIDSPADMIDPVCGTLQLTPSIVESDAEESNSGTSILPSPPTVDSEQHPNTPNKSTTKPPDQSKIPTLSKHESENEDLKKQLNALWSDNKKLRSALQTVDIGVKNVTQQLLSVQQSVQQQSTTLENVITAIETKFDAKISTFMEATIASMDVNLATLETRFNTECSQIRTIIGSHKLYVGKQIKSIGEFECKCQHNDTINEVNQKLQDIDIYSLNKISDDVEYLLNDKERYEADAAKLHKLTSAVDHMTRELANLRSEQNDLKTNVSYINSVRNTLPQSNNNNVIRNHDNNQHPPAQHMNLPTSSATPIHRQSFPPGLPPISTSVPPIINYVSRPTNGTPTAIPHSIETLICMDSNRNIIDRKKLWRINGTKYLPCSTINDVSEALRYNIRSDTKCILIHCGTNDLDTKHPQRVAYEIHSLISKIKAFNPNIKIVLSELLPRKDLLDNVVLEVNDILKSWYEQDKYVYLVHHNKLRDNDLSCLRDAKHLTQNIAPKFAFHLKFGLRWAFNEPRNNPSTTPDTIRRADTIQSAGTPINSLTPSALSTSTNNHISKSELCEKLILAIKSILQ